MNEDQISTVSAAQMSPRALGGSFICKVTAFRTYFNADAVNQFAKIIVNFLGGGVSDSSEFGKLSAS
jgi:hypothetical protein